MTTAVATWAEVMAERATKRAAALAAGKSTAEQAERDAALCDLFTRHCVTAAADADRIMAMPVDQVEQLHNGCIIAERIARMAYLDAAAANPTPPLLGSRRHQLHYLARDARAAIDTVRARIATAHQAMGDTIPHWCRA